MRNPGWPNPDKIIEFNERWNFLQEGIEKLKNILEANGETPEPEPITHADRMLYYSEVYNMSFEKSHDFSGLLYQKYKQTIDEYNASHVLPSITEKEGEFLLREFARRWGNNKVMVEWFRRIFHYLNRYYVIRMSLPTLEAAGLNSFLDLVFLQLKGKLRDVVITLIDKDLKGDQIDRGTLKKALEAFVELGDKYYENDIEETMLKEMDAYYSRKAVYWIEEHSCHDYLFKIEECLTREKARISVYLPSSSQDKVTELLQKILLEKYAIHFLENEQFGFMALLMNDDKVEDLSRMYRLFHKIPKGLELMVNMFKQQLSHDTKDLDQPQDEEEDRRVYLRKVAEVHEKYLTINTCFSNDILFRKVIEETFVVFCNKDVGGCSGPEFLASYCEDILKGGGSHEKLGDEEVGDTLEKVGKLLAYMKDKDVFVEYHRNKLSRRLLIDKTANEDHERRILSTLKQYCGAEFTSKMEGMLTDLTLSKENQNLWKEYLREKYKEEDGKPGGIDFNVTILTTGLWPKSYQPFDHINLPAEMLKCIQVFKEFYSTRTQNRKLRWINSIGTCNIEGKFESKTIHLIVSTYQAAVLMLFNSADRLSYSEIKTQLNLGDEDDDYLTIILKSLSSARYNILIKDTPSDPDPNPNPDTVTVSASVSSPNEEYFEFNTKFTHRMQRIKIPWPFPKDRDEKKIVTEEVDKDRRHAVDAAIVRIMKSRKVLEHQALVIECVRQLGSIFKPDIKLIKQRIENLISRDFLERHHRNKSIYRYVA